MSDEDQGRSTSSAPPETAQDTGGQATAEPDAPTSEQEFREQQKLEASAQLLTGDNAVPDRRPAAFDQVDDSHQSPTYRALKAANHPIVNDEPMGKAAYDKANSDSQRRKASKVERYPRIAAAEPVQIVIDDKDDPNYVFSGRYAAVIQVNYADTEAERIAAAGTPESAFAEVESYVVRVRDERTDTIQVKPDQLRPARNNEVVKTLA